MSIVCSIPGCNGRRNISREVKLYRVPAVAVGSSTLIFNLTTKRRKQWFAVLEHCGLSEANCTSYRVCSNHFREGKPSPMFDTKSKDWVPNLNLPVPGSFSVSDKPEAEEVVKIERKRGRPKKKDIVKENTPVRSKSIGRSKLVGSSKSFSRSKSVDPAKLTESEDEKTESEQPFVFVDIQKIKEGVQVPVKEPTPAPTPPSKVKCDSPKVRSKGTKKRSFGVQTNPNVLPPLHWGRNRSKKQKDPRYRTTSVQTEPVSKFKLAVSENDSFQACLGEIIEFIRKQMLGFNLRALGNNFKIEECSLHFQKEGETAPKDKSSNTVVVHLNKLHSSNWPLLESVAMSLDLYRLHQRNDQTPTGFLRTLFGKTETIEKMSDVLARNNVKKNNDKMVLEEIEISDDDCEEIPRSPQKNSSDTESLPDEKPIISPILPKITSVRSIAEEMDSAASVTTPVKQGSSRKRLAKVTVPPPHLVPTITRLTPKKSRQIGDTLNDKISTEENADIQGILGTTKVARVILPKLPKSLVEKASSGATIPLGNFSTILKGSEEHTDGNEASTFENTSTSAPILWVPNVTKDGTLPTQISVTNELTNTPISFKSVKNIPLKLPQSPGVAGYLLVPNTSATGTPAPIMYVPNVGNEKMGSPPKINFEDVLKKALPGVQTLLLPGGSAPNIPGSVTPTCVTPVVTSQMVPISSSSKHTGTPSTVHLDNSTSPIINSPIKVSLEKSKISAKEAADDIKNEHLESDLDNGDALLRCPYCLKDCKDGNDFINHHKTTGCRVGKKTIPNPMIKCEYCNEFYQRDSLHDCQELGNKVEKFPDCNVCGRMFARSAYLANHVKTHVEYTKWTVKCVECPKKFPNQQQLQAHTLEWHPPTSEKPKSRYRCDKCEKKYLTQKGLDFHVEKSHSSAKKKCTIKIRCKFCRSIFDLEYYRKVHWTECQENRKKQEENIVSTEYVEETSEEILQETPKKPTGIRSNFKEPKNNLSEFGNSVEEQLSKIFGDDDSSAESSAPEYEHEELLHEDFEDVKTEYKIVETEIKNEKPKERKKKRRFRNLEGADTDEEFDSPMMKFPKLNVEENNKSDDEILNNGLNLETAGSSEISLKKVDINSFFSVDGGSNDIVIEEMDDDQYFSS